MSDSQGVLPGFEIAPATARQSASSSTFLPNLRLPLHRWFRFSAGYSGQWVSELLKERDPRQTFVFDPFCGSGTTTLAAELAGFRAAGNEAQPFICRVARAKHAYRAGSRMYLDAVRRWMAEADSVSPGLDEYPDLIGKCFERDDLARFDQFRRGFLALASELPASLADLLWLTLVVSLRLGANAGTAPWQYILPGREKKAKLNPDVALRRVTEMFSHDMQAFASLDVEPCQIYQADSRDGISLPEDSVSLVVTSPPYANNYDYADATRFELSFLLEVGGWADLKRIREDLLVACSQHAAQVEESVEDLLVDPLLSPIRPAIARAYEELSLIRHSKGGKKQYHLMVVHYFHGIARVFQQLARVCAPDCELCFVLGDSAPYGVHLPVYDWYSDLGALHGFETSRFEKLRDRNMRWKNRKHRVPLSEGNLWMRRS